MYQKTIKMNKTNNSKSTIDIQIESLLKNLVEEEGFQNYKIEKAPGSMKGDGYLGVITIVDVIGETNSGNKKTLHLIIKSASKSDAVRIESPLTNLYERETYMYDTVLPEFRRFAKEKGLASFPASARCYKTSVIEKSEALILENLKEAGYSVWERNLPMEHHHISLVMKEYGRFHALSLALKDQEPEKFTNLTNNMYDIFYRFMETANITKMYENQCRRALHSLNPTANKKAYNVFEKFIADVDGILKYIPKLIDKYSVIIHGDCWTNNMMFKYEDKQNPRKPTKMCLIDLQMSRLGSPVLDLSYFFYACSSKTVLDNLEEYQRIYHDSLSDYLRKLGSDPENLYPYSVLREQWKNLAKFGLICALLVIHVMLSEREECTDFAEIAESGKSVMEAFDYDIANSEAYNERVRHIILHFVNNGFM